MRGTPDHGCPGELVGEGGEIGGAGVARVGWTLRGQNDVENVDGVAESGGR